MRADLFTYLFSSNFFAIVSLLLAFGHGPDSVAAIEEKLPSVRAKKIELTENPQVLIYPAKVESKVYSVILADSEGIVRDIINLGSEVKRGAKLMSIRNSDPVYQYAPMAVKAPVTGVLSEVFVSEGAQVIKGEKLATVIDPKQVRLSIEVPSSDLASLERGMKAQFIFERNSQTQDVPVVIEGISPLVNSTTGTATAVLKFTDVKKSALAPGSFGKVEFSLADEKRIVLDEYSIVYKNSQPYVRVIEDQISKYRPVVLGPRSFGKVVIMEGLKPGELIVEKTSQYVPDNKKVKIEE